MIISILYFKYTSVSTHIMASMGHMAVAVCTVNPLIILNGILLFMCSMDKLCKRDKISTSGKTKQTYKKNNSFWHK